MLHRYWLIFDVAGEVHVPSRLRLGCGVTAYDRNDAMNILEREVFGGGLVPKVIQTIEDVDVSTLDENHVLPNMETVTLRGVWYPKGYAFVH